VNSFS